MTSVALGLPGVRFPGGASPSGRETTRSDARDLVDRFGRVARDLRVSLTDRCNLRCGYCMPEEGLEWLAPADQLSDAEVVRLIGIAVTRLGIREVRFTGGEPLLRRGLDAVVAAVARLSPRPEISLTTNGVGLSRRARLLAAAGVVRLNISLDSLRRAGYEQITRRDRLDDVMAGLAAATDAGLAPVKINSVLLRGVNDDEALALLHFAIAHGYELRFIEQMPLDAQRGRGREQMVTAGKILRSLGSEFELTPEPHQRGSAPAEQWLINGGPARVGIIASVPGPSAPAATGHA